MSTKYVSKYSAAMIGTVDSGTDRHREAREVFKKEAREVSKVLESNHYSRRLKNMQVYYPDTISKLSHAPAQRHEKPVESHHRAHPRKTIGNCRLVNLVPDTNQPSFINC